MDLIMYMCVAGEFAVLGPASAPEFARPHEAGAAKTF